MEKLTQAQEEELLKDDDDKISIGSMSSSILGAEMEKLGVNEDTKNREEQMDITPSGEPNILTTFVPNPIYLPTYEATLPTIVEEEEEESSKVYISELPEKRIYKIPRDSRAMVAHPQKPRLASVVHVVENRKKIMPLLSLPLISSSNVMSKRETKKPLKRLNNPDSGRKTDRYRNFRSDGSHKPICYKCGVIGHVQKYCPGPSSTRTYCIRCRQQCSDHDICDRCRFSPH
jgi:hypothetical protein